MPFMSQEHFQFSFAKAILGAPDDNILADQTSV